MGTRGLIVLIVKGARHGAYNHMDSYPSGLGQDIVNFLLNLKPEEYATMMKLVSEIEWVDESSTPSLVLQRRYSELGWCNLDVSARSMADWYCFLNNIQGAALLPAIKRGEVKHIVERVKFLEDNFPREWAYLIDFEKQTLDTWNWGGLLHTITFEKLKEKPVGCMGWLQRVSDGEEKRDAEWGSKGKTGDGEDTEDESTPDIGENEDKKDEEGYVVVQENTAKNREALGGDKE